MKNKYYQLIKDHLKVYIKDYVWLWDSMLVLLAFVLVWALVAP